MAKRWIVMFAGLLAAAPGHAATAPCLSPPVPSLSARELSQNGVIVKSGERVGLGFVVGWRQDEAWVAVPAHVVYGEGVYPLPAEMAGYRAGLKIQLFGDSAPRRLCDKDPTPPQGLADLAFVCVDWIGRPAFNNGVLARRVRVGDQLTLVESGNGQQHRGSVSQAARADQKVEKRGDIEANGLGGIRGQSGAFVASAGGVVGLYLARLTDYSILSMSAIHYFADLVDVPWQLTDTEYYDCTAARNVCFTTETAIVPANVTLRSIFTAGSYPLSQGSCAALPEGRYEIVVPPLGPTCEPKTISVYAAAANLPLALQCSVALMGTWRTEDGDELRCIEVQMGRAQCSGLAKQGFGFFSGSIDAKGQDFSMLGSFIDPSGNSLPAKGSLHWSEGFLIGEIQRQLEPPRPLKLKRMEEK